LGETVNQEIKSRWLAALRSDDYTQGRNYLRTTTVDVDPVVQHCCLGVLCELAVADGVVAAGEDRPSDFIRRWAFPIGDGGYNDGTLPDEVMDWAGLSDSDPGVPFGDDDSLMLSSVNDDEGLSFAEIANLIEEYL